MRPGSPPPSPRVRIVPLLGPDTLQSSSIDGVLLDVPLPPDVPELDASGLADVKVLLFSAALEPREAALANVHCVTVGGELRATVREAASTVQPDADEVATQYAEQFVAMGVGLVACRAQCPRAAVQQHLHRRHQAADPDPQLRCAEKGISSALRGALLDRGILPLERLSLRHIHSVQAVSGCRLMTDLSAAVRAAAGRHRGCCCRRPATDAALRGRLSRVRPAHWAPLRQATPVPSRSSCPP